MSKWTRDRLTGETPNTDHEAGTYENPIRYARIADNDPDRRAKLAAQRDKFGRDADAGKVLCLSDLMISHGM